MYKKKRGRSLCLIREMKYEEALDLGIIEFLRLIYKQLHRSPELVHIVLNGKGGLKAESILGADLEPGLTLTESQVNFEGIPQLDGIYRVYRNWVYLDNEVGGNIPTYSLALCTTDLLSIKFSLNLYELFQLYCDENLDKACLNYLKRKSLESE